MIRVLIAEDQTIIREGLQYIIERDSGIRVVGLAGDGKEAWELCEALVPDLVLMDIVMPECNGIEGTQKIKAQFPEIKVLILTTFADAENVSQALQNGADGYVLKDIEAEDLILTIKSIAKGLRVMHGNPFETVVKSMAGGRTAAPPAETVMPNLNPKEMEIMRLIVYGNSNKEIAALLNNSEGSVRNAISAILTKLKLEDRTQLAVFAVRNNLV